MKKAAIIGSGFSSLSAACYLAKAGYNVTVLEKNDSLGGRARQLEKGGFKFDMGPTWYWMPDVFERFFNDFGHEPFDFYKLTKLSPGYEVYFGKEDSMLISDRIEDIYRTFEKEEPGSSKALKKFLKLAERNYDIAIKNLVYKPGLSPLELVTKDTVTEMGQFVRTMHAYLTKHFKSRKLRQILEFPVLFLGAKPQDTPLFYAFMNHADFVLGTWYPEGGMYAVTQGIIELAGRLGVKFITDFAVDEIITDEVSLVKGVRSEDKKLYFDVVISGADYHHTEQLLPEKFRNYDTVYWNKKTMAPSALLFYVGFDCKIANVQHHTLFFDESFEAHVQDIYDDPKWPAKPLFYASFPSKTDSFLAPAGKEAAIFLIPLAPDLEDTPELRAKYFDMIMQRLQYLTGQALADRVVVRESFCVSEFKSAYNSFKGNAYGMANTLMQTAFLRPKLRNKHLINLYYTGQLTVPGPGVPPALISGKLVSELVINNTHHYEGAI